MKTLKLIPLLFLLMLVISCGGNEKQAEVPEQNKAELRKAAADFMSELKGILMNQVKTNGFASAVKVCSDTARVLTSNFGMQRGIFIKRVSFKNRNKNDYPDEFESKVIKQFEQMKEEGKLDKTTEYFEVVKEGEFKYLRYVKPIIVEAPCLNCHGSSDVIPKEVKEILSKKYPDDKATGYVVGDLRGAVSVKKLIK